MKAGFKDIAKDLFYHFGISKFLLQILRCRRHAKLLILTYHRVCPSLNKHEYLSIPAEIFERHIKFVKDNFKTVSMSDGLKAFYEDNSNEIYAVINLDDGYMDNYLYAYPILKKYDVPATIFLTTDFIGKEHIFWWDRVFNIISSLKSGSIRASIDSESFYFKLDGACQRRQVVDYINNILKNKNEEKIGYLIKGLEREFPSIKEAKPSLMLGWKEIEEMSQDLISFGSHAKTHKNLCILKDEEVWKELVDSKRKIEKRLKIEISQFAYPFGMFDERIRDLVKKAGFKCARTVLKGSNYKNSDIYSLDAIIVESLLNTNFLEASIAFNSFK